MAHTLKLKLLFRSTYGEMYSYLLIVNNTFLGHTVVFNVILHLDIRIRTLAILKKFI